jgi:DAK2 domain fusion protein YloV
MNTPTEAGVAPAASSAAPDPDTVPCATPAFLDALRSASAWLDAHVDLVNSLNVFPVPDGDTGTNMSLTMRAALEEVDDIAFASVSQAARVIADGALMGARGNSGVILSQVLRGMARALDGRRDLGAADLARALKEGAATAYKGVMKPVEGTMLTVAREAAEAAMRAAEGGADVGETLAAALVEAQQSLERTPSLLPVLAEAGVVDSGGQGLVILLEGALRYVHGERVDRQPTAVGVAAHTEHGGPEQYNYDVQFIIQGTDLDVAAIRERIATMGDSVLVVGDARAVKVHVHCDLPGQAIDYGISQGRVTAVLVENMQLQYEEFKARAAADPSRNNGDRLSLPEEMAAVSIIAVASGEGLSRVLESIGVSAIVSGGQTMNPSTQDLLQAIERVPSNEVIVLPNNGNIVLAARQAQELAAKKVAVVPTRTVPEGIAALLAFNYQATLEDNVALMQDAATHVQTIEITRAVRSAQVNGLSVREGQIIGLLNGDLVVADERVEDVVGQLLESVGAAECEILTIYYGADVTEDEAEVLAEEMRARYPELEIEVLDGGQAHYHYVISAE